MPNGTGAAPLRDVLRFCAFADPPADCWTDSQCGRVLDCPLSCRASKFSEHLFGHPDFVAAHLDRVCDHTLLERHPSGARGLCSFTVQVAGPTAKSESSDRHSRVCGDACARFFGCLRTQESSPDTASLPWRWAGWDFGQSDPDTKRLQSPSFLPNVVPGSCPFPPTHKMWTGGYQRNIWSSGTQSMWGTKSTFWL